jgi:hypothetical protein
MSYGSRANQVNPEALIILFRAIHLKPLFAGNRRSISVRAVIHLTEIFFAHFEFGPRTVAQSGAETNDCARE